MNEKIDRGIPIGFTIIIILIAGLFIACFGLIIHSEITREYATVEGKIIDTDFRTEWIGGMQKRDILTITMDDNSTYDILIRDDYIDLTVNSHMILKLTKAGGNTVWEIEHIIKVPDVEEG